MNEIKHVYILGAGFSVPLGGPLFNDLLTVKFDGIIEDEFRSYDSPQGIYLKTLPKILENLRMVPDFNFKTIELLLEKIDELKDCTNERLANHLCGPYVEIFNTVRSELSSEFTGISPDLQSRGATYLHDLISRLIRTRLAIETSHFATKLSPNSDRWIPYDLWFKGLSEHDTIITFNYDPVIEILAKKNNVDLSGLRRTSGRPRLLKLHGSANWYTVDGSEIRELHLGGSIAASLFIEGRMAVIGTPGSSKGEYRQGILKPFWDDAKQAIQDANIVSIIGYSMPETDNLAREFILDSLLSSLRNKYMVDVVLGPGSSGPNADRIGEMLRQLFQFDRLGSFQDAPKVLPAYAQDYLHRYRPKNFDDVTHFRDQFATSKAFCRTK